MKRRILSAFAVLALCAALGAVAFLTGCFGHLTKEQEESMLKQYAAWMEQEEPYEAEYLPYHTVASWRLFGTEAEGEYTYIYADVLDGSYVLFEKRAYLRSGGRMPVRIKAKEEGGALRLIDVGHPIDGEDYWDSVKEMYPGKYFWQYKYYERFADFSSQLEEGQEEMLKKVWGGDVRIERENLMDIDDGGNYRIWRTADEEPWTTVIKEGKL